MQITAFKATLARRINIQGCDDYENTFARMESDCTLRFGFKVLIKSISYTKQQNGLENSLRHSEKYFYRFLPWLRRRFAGLQFLGKS